MTKWDGVERRKITDEGIEGRRISDQHCGEHHILWKHHDEDKSDHRQAICWRIGKVEREVEKLWKQHADDIKNISSCMTPWKVFALSMGVLIVLFGWLGQEIKSGNNELKGSFTVLHRRISEKDLEMSSETNGLKEAINKVNSSIQSLENRIKDVEKAVDARGFEKPQRRTP